MDNEELKNNIDENTSEKDDLNTQEAEIVKISINSYIYMNATSSK